MTTETPAAVAKGLSTLAKLAARATPAELRDLIADGLLKADDYGLMEGQASANPHYVHDQWDGDGATMPALHHVTGGASAPRRGGTISIGNPQAASGDGAVAMQREYSNPAPQGGIADVAQEFGRMLTRMDTVAKARHAQLENRFSLMSTVLEKAIGQLADMAKPPVAAVAKAEDKEDKEEKDEKDDEKEEFEKSVFTLVSKAKTNIAKARKFAAKGIMLGVEGDKGGAAAVLTLARAAVSKASQAFDGIAKLDSGNAVIAELNKGFVGLAKALPPNEAENQDIWPASDLSPVGKAKDGEEEDDDEKEMEKAIAAAKAAAVSQTPVSAGVQPAQNNAELAAAVERISKSLEGVQMLSTDVKGLMGSLAGQSRDPQGLPPVFSLAKANPEGFASTRAQAVSDALASGAIRDRDADLARDIIGQLSAAAKGLVPEEVPQQRLRMIQPALRALITGAAA